MIVYLLYRGEYDSRDVSSVHATMESAKAAKHDGHEPVWGEEHSDTIDCAWSLVHPGKAGKAVMYEVGTVPVVDGVAVLPGGREVQTTAAYVNYPIPPENMDSGYRLEWTQYCDVSIVTWAVTR